MIDVEKAIATVVKTGKVAFGAKEAIRSVKAGKAQLIFLASSSSSTKREDLEYYGKLSQIPVVTYTGTSTDLGMVCGKKFAVATLTVKEPGDSDILTLADMVENGQETAERGH